jgi:hypothetical protein
LELCEGFISNLFGALGKAACCAVVKDEPDREKELSYFWSWNAWLSSWWATQTTRQVSVIYPEFQMK